MLEPYDGKLSRTVLRREGGGNTADPADYSPLVNRLKGQVIKISPNSTQFINPMDINANYSEEDNPLSLKADFILSLCELVVGGKEGLLPVEKTVIDRCVHLIYRKYFADPCPENMPILEDLYNALLQQDEKEAHHVATALEIYVKGSLNLFNHRTNVNVNNRIVCYDIKELGKQMKKLGMLIVQDQVWGRVTANRSSGKSTRYYMDEMHLLLKEEQTAAYSVEIWKRFRKWGGIPTGLTQNVKDLLSSREVENIFENSDMIIMLNQAAGDRQILAKQLIFREGILLAVPSIPLGLLFGFLIAKVSFNWLVEQGNLVSSGIKNHQVPLFSLTIMLICIFVSFLTVVLALRKPMKIVSRISPIEATRYLDGSKTQKQGRRKGRKDVTVFSMAMANVTGNPKRTIATILTMGLSCVLFVIISNYVGNIDTEHEARIAINHGQFELQLDYSQNYDEAYSENNLDTILQNNPLNDSLIKEIKSIPGVTDVLTREIVSADLNGTKFPVAIVNQEDFEMMRGDGDIGSMDYAQAVKNGDVFFGWSMWMEADGYSAGAPITFNFDNGSGTYTYHGKIAGSFVSADTYLVIPEEVYRSVNPKGTSYGYLWVDCAKKDVASVEQSLNDLLSDTSHIKLNTYHAELQTAEYASRMMKLGCYLFMAIVGLIGFMNLANTMIINITTKKQEYGVLQAVGMTNKQLNLSLQIQGLIFTVGTICVALAAGLPLGYALFSYAKHNGMFGMNVYHVPLIPILVMILLVGILQIVLSCVLSSNLKKETLVERIRYQG